MPDQWFNNSIDGVQHLFEGKFCRLFVTTFAIFHHATFQPAISNNDSMRNANQVGFGKLNARSLCPVVEQYLETLIVSLLI